MTESDMLGRQMFASTLLVFVSHGVGIDPNYLTDFSITSNEKKWSLKKFQDKQVDPVSGVISFGELLSIDGECPDVLKFELGKDYLHGVWQGIRLLTEEFVHVESLALSFKHNPPPLVSPSLRVHIYRANQRTFRIPQPFGKTGIEQVKYFYKREIKQKMKTGDLIFFSGRTPLSMALMCVSGQPFSSVGMVVKIPEKYTQKKRLFIMEISTDQYMPDAFREDREYGLCVFDLEKRLHVFNGPAAWWVPINEPLSLEVEEYVVTWANLLHKNPSSALQQLVVNVPQKIQNFLLEHNISKETKESLSELLCCALVVKILVLAEKLDREELLNLGNFLPIDILQLQCYQNSKRELLKSNLACAPLYSTGDSVPCATISEGLFSSQLSNLLDWKKNMVQSRKKIQRRTTTNVLEKRPSSKHIIHSSTPLNSIRPPSGCLSLSSGIPTTATVTTCTITLTPNSIRTFTPTSNSTPAPTPASAPAPAPTPAPAPIPAYRPKTIPHHSIRDQIQQILHLPNHPRTLR
eukprot:TRINITY_DN9219_c0_g1_i3.p1 TRINITY_DN9219_c0_g1~~TRINITY_DN9219_c0_g1_i3.p1  ORF type:complete len:540 (-),score=84.34 TRINITY_DN9219_c0_g1_i3:12-1574(-)